MKATIIEDFGGTDVFASAELEKPNVKPGHVVVKVAATSVNTIDMMIRQMGTDLLLHLLYQVCWAWISPVLLTKLEKA